MAMIFFWDESKAFLCYTTDAEQISPYGHRSDEAISTTSKATAV